MSAAMLSLGERIASELGRGELDQVYVRGSGGYVILMSVGEEAVLTILADEKPSWVSCFLRRGGLQWISLSICSGWIKLV